MSCPECTWEDDDPRWGLGGPPRYPVKADVIETKHKIMAYAVIIFTIAPAAIIWLWFILWLWEAAFG